MELKPRAPIERMSGKVNGQNSHGPYRRLRDYVMAKCAAKLKEETAK